MDSGKFDGQQVFGEYDWVEFFCCVFGFGLLDELGEYIFWYLYVSVRVYVFYVLEMLFYDRFFDFVGFVLCLVVCNGDKRVDNGVEYFWEKVYD